MSESIDILAAQRLVGGPMTECNTFAGLLPRCCALEKKAYPAC